jgi:hypothetical protein
MSLTNKEVVLELYETFIRKLLIIKSELEGDYRSELSTEKALLMSQCIKTFNRIEKMIDNKYPNKDVPSVIFEHKADHKINYIKSKMEAKENYEIDSDISSLDSNGSTYFNVESDDDKPSKSLYQICVDSDYEPDEHQSDDEETYKVYGKSLIRMDSHLGSKHVIPTRTKEQEDNINKNVVF